MWRPSLRGERRSSAGNGKAAGEIIENPVTFGSRERSEGVQQIVADIAGLTRYPKMQFPIDCNSAAYSRADENRNHILVTGGSAHLELAVQRCMHIVHQENFTLTHILQSIPERKVGEIWNVGRILDCGSFLVDRPAKPIPMAETLWPSSFAPFENFRTTFVNSSWNASFSFGVLILMSSRTSSFSLKSANCVFVPPTRCRSKVILNCQIYLPPITFCRPLARGRPNHSPEKKTNIPTAIKRKHKVSRNNAADEIQIDAKARSQPQHAPRQQTAGNPPKAVREFLWMLLPVQRRGRHDERDRLKAEKGLDAGQHHAAFFDELQPLTMEVLPAFFRRTSVIPTFGYKTAR